MNKFIIIALVLFCTQFKGNSQNNDQIFTVYLVRHAEKELSPTNSKDPHLTACGENRSKSIANFLELVDLDVIYSTAYKRTIETADPTASSKGLEIKKYDPTKLKDFAKLLKEAKRNALVVGHSNTTGVLAGLLAGKEIGSFDESIYNRIYQVIFFNDKVSLQILNSTFKCED
jgi:broad specificity phosphatase PhoE